MKMRHSKASLHLFCCCLLIHFPAKIIRTSLPFATYYQQPSNHQTLNPAQNPLSSTYTFMQAPHISAFHVIQTRESIPPETAVVVQIEIIPESTPNKENQITMLSGERWIARKPRKNFRIKPDCKQPKQRCYLQLRNKIKPRLNWRSRM